MLVLNHLQEKKDAANMLREHLASKVHLALESGRRARLDSRSLEEWQPIRDKWLQCFRAAFPLELLTRRKDPLNAHLLTRVQREGYWIETIIFESLWGWEVNAHICIPDGKPPFPAVILPTGHSAKTGSSYQIPPVVLARNGFLTITFDAPWQGEKGPGNDHFNQGMTCALTGLWSETFFAMDALRAIDYLLLREDVDTSHGVGMTGISGGGETTMTCALLDDRIHCIAPVCSTGAQRILGAEFFYTSCPETMGPGLFAQGIDVPEKLALIAPMPALIISGEKDELYSKVVVHELVDELRYTYSLYEQPDHLDHYEQQETGHEYTVLMAERVAAWMKRWLCDEPHPQIQTVDPVKILEAAEVINCHPNTARNMQTINCERSDLLSKNRSRLTLDQTRTALREILNPGRILQSNIYSTSNELSWKHRVERIALVTDEDILVPALVIINTDIKTPQPVILWIDDRGKWNALKQEEWLLKSCGFLQQSGSAMAHLCCIDARGWGETEAEHVAYDLAWWNDINRILSYMSIALNQPLPGQRVRDVLTALAYLRSRENIDPSRIILGGHGAGALVALYAALLDGKVSGYMATRILYSFHNLVETENYTWTHDIIIPRLLNYFDISDLMAVLPCQKLIVNPVDAKKNLVTASEYLSDDYTHFNQSNDKVSAIIMDWLRGVASNNL